MSLLGMCRPAVHARPSLTSHQAPPALHLPNLNPAGFIFGKNTSRKAADGAANEKVAMTAPVVMQDTTTGAAAAAPAPSEKVAMTAPVVMQNTTEPASAAPAASEKVAMTAPVVMQHASDTQQQQQQAPTSSSSTRTMSFIMPSKYSSPEDLPVPKDARVKLVQVGFAWYAVPCVTAPVINGQHLLLMASCLAGSRLLLMVIGAAAIPPL